MSYDELTAKLLRKTEQQAARIERLEADTLRLYRIGMEGLQDFAAQRKEVKRLRAALRDDPTPEQIYSACLSYRHDFGLLPVEDRKAVVFDATEWLRAWQKTLGERT